MAPCAASVCGRCGTRHNGLAAEDVISWLVKSVLGMCLYSMLGCIHHLAYNSAEHLNDCASVASYLLNARQGQTAASIRAAGV